MNEYLVFFKPTSRLKFWEKFKKPLVNRKFNRHFEDKEIVEVIDISDEAAIIRANQYAQIMTLESDF